MVFSQPIDVRFADLDALAHVNHAVIVSYLEHARTQWWRGLLEGRPFEAEGFLMARVEVDYRKSIQLGDAVVVELRCVHLGRTSFTLAYRVVREEDSAVLAEARTVQVMVDFQTMRPRPLGPQVEAWLKTQQ
jgi:acyl-CoA thioester hydrolase